MKKWFLRDRHWAIVLGFIAAFSFLGYAIADTDWDLGERHFPDPPESQSEELIEEVINDGSS